jgi:tetratricopeptide (TPR) repeat protein
MLLPLLVAAALAEDKPDLLVVGVHLAGTLGAAAQEAAERATETLDRAGTVEALGPNDVSRRISGREALVLESFALGPGRQRLKDAQLLYDRANVEEALPEAEDAVALLQRGMEVSTSARELHDAWVLLGMIRVALGDDKAASSAFRKAAALDVARELDAVNFPPRVIELYDGARGDLVKKSPATCHIQTSVGARVYLDGKDLGTAPVESVRLVPGDHYLLVRAAGGASRFESVSVTAGESRVVDVALESKGLGTALADNPGRSRQVKDLYRALGEYDDKTAILIAGSLPGGQVGAQLYAPLSGNFSRVVTAEAGDDPLGSLLDLLPTVGGYLSERGDVRADRVGAQVLPLDIGTNAVLAGLLLDPPALDSGPTTTTVVRSGVPWWVWAGTGAVVAGAGTAVAVVLTQDQSAPPSETDQGTIVLGPMP